MHRLVFGLALVSVMVIAASATYAQETNDHRVVLAQIRDLQLRLIPKPGDTWDDIQSLWGTPIVTNRASYHSGPGRVQHSGQNYYFELIEHYWLTVCVSEEGECVMAGFEFADPRSPWAEAGLKEFNSPEHAKRRLEFLKAMAQKIENQTKEKTAKTALPN